MKQFVCVISKDGNERAVNNMVGIKTRFVFAVIVIELRNSLGCQAKIEPTGSG